MEAQICCALYQQGFTRTQILIIAPCAHAHSGVKRLLCQSISQSVCLFVSPAKRSSDQLSSLGDFIAHIHNASSVTLASLYLEASRFADTCIHFLFYRAIVMMLLLIIATRMCPVYRTVPNCIAGLVQLLVN